MASVTTKFSLLSEPKGNDVQLVDGVTPNRGRVEFFVDGAWRRVCTEENPRHDSVLAHVVCLRLGYARSFFARSFSLSKEEKETGNYFFLSCTWIKGGSCSFRRDRCDSELFISCQSSRTYSIRLRLDGGSMPSAGNVSVNVHGTWLNSCLRTPFPIPAICRHLGYDSGSATSSFRIRNPNSAYITCPRSLLGECTISSKYYCTSSLTIHCYYSANQVRLVNAVKEPSKSEGEVEIYYRRYWTGICDDHWTINEANVFCRQLGYTNAISARPQRLISSNVTRSQRIEIYCSGREANLGECTLLYYSYCRSAVAVCTKNECKQE